ncbi:PEP-CTERM sorting domain-containing protein [Microcystis aeruginosa BLCCF158]|uniref:PEP-CTERM sorting domain-containing protein n=1 Tax=Microcystis aeruginosa BLCC-F158 TaxID=2755316 RepID=A0A841V8J7_MICAE|nr:PEP-CTERM sorting domain-containing protein [Microcystis aeruginosa]MBC1197250.1 PEP-CTERM sorting domain-containing protein [Microcystis aeruginosa BLCC-F158]
MSLKTSLAGAATAIGLAALAYPAQAATYYFTYTHGGPTVPIVVTGTVTGTLSGSLLTVSTVDSLAYNGNTLTGWTVNGSYSVFAGGTPLPPNTNPNLAPIIDVTSAYLGTDILFTDATNSGPYIAFGPAGVDPSVNPGGLSFASTSIDPAFGANTNGVEEVFGTFTITPKSTSVPEPGAVVALLGLGLGALASKIRKQA